MGKLLFLAAALVAAPSCPAAAEIPTCPFVLQAVHPHDGQAFTQGLLFRRGHLYESTGLLGRSTIRKVRPSDGKVLTKVSLPKQVFGEGLASWGDELLSITWRDGVGYRWSADTLALVGTFAIAGEGWGLTATPDAIVLSDGTDTLQLLEPDSMTVRRTIRVTADGLPLDKLNELEWADGSILANVWLTNRIARIDPESGKVTAWVDLSRLVENRRRVDPDHVMNGIAYDIATDSLFVTGKGWLEMYQIRVGDCGS